MKKIILSISFITVFLATMLRAEYRLNFFVGDVRVEVNGKSVEPRIGMAIPSNAIIITGRNPRRTSTILRAAP